MLKSGMMYDSVYMQLWETITKGKAWKGELCNKKKNGEFYWENTIISPVYNRNFKITQCKYTN
ncbi:MAG TPA: hypothetical protein DCQ31_07810 [Bacteroidales bacterium]|nr:hypothetical protein [Bacteroidales bacterium]